MVKKTDFLIVGSGLAGLNAALEASHYGDVVLVTKTNLEASSSYWAQGGVAAVLEEPDSFECHVKDTLEAGRGYCNRNAVELLVREGSDRIKDLIEMGMPFDRDGEVLNLGMEGGHSERRILHANGAATGKAMVEFLIKKIRKSANISIIEHAFVYDLISSDGRCMGAYAYLYKAKERLKIISGSTILATGGYSALFTRSTNPHTSTGDGLWLAWNHGAILKDLEFVQFHPTAFYDHSGEVFLISEALRGEGARLLNTSGERFMEKYPKGDLSPRDLVSSEIVKQIEQQKENNVYLDLTHLNPENLKARFPGLVKRIESYGIDISKQGIPIAPAAHYSIGGVETDMDGKTAVNGLYACGEVAATGVHGANRLASNSLLECLVFSKRSVEHARKNRIKAPLIDTPVKRFKINHEHAEPFLIQKRVVTSLLNRYAGIERNCIGLNKALTVIESELKSPLYNLENEYYLLRMREMVKIAEMILHSGLERKESRGVHSRTDYPEPSNSEITPICHHKSQFFKKQAAS